jgi:PqqD family protein of HPr-rel-A system
LAASKALNFTSASSNIFWAVPNTDQLVWLGWDGFYMVFHPASGEMHLLDGLAREIVDVIAGKPCTEAELLLQMAEIFDSGLSPELSKKIMGSLAELDKIGLLEPVERVAAS